jgi:tetratricopeptide (TPR) repeat protein
VSSDLLSPPDARTAVQERPNDPEARLDLARAAQAEGEIDEAIAALERYRTMRPEDPDALRTLAALYGTQIAAAQQRSAIAANEAAEASLPTTLAPTDSGFLQDLLGNPISESLSNQANARASAADAEVQTLSALQLGVFETLTELVTDEPLLYRQLALAAETAQDYETAITAYESFLDASPNNPNAEQIQERIDALKTISGAAEGAGGNGSGGGSGGDSDGE